MTDYVFLRNADGEIEGCDACRVEVPTAEFARTDDGVKRLCEVCATSDTGNIIERPTANDPLLRTTAAAANVILAAMGRFARAATVEAALADKERVRDPGLDGSPPIVLTEAEQVMFDTYTTHSRSNQVALMVGKQYFNVNDPTEDAAGAVWMRSMLAKALATIVRERTAATPTRG